MTSFLQYAIVSAYAFLACTSCLVKLILRMNFTNPYEQSTNVPVHMELGAKYAFQFHQQNCVKIYQ